MNEKIKALPLASQKSSSWLHDDAHKAFLIQDAKKQIEFFAKSLRPDGGFDVLDYDGKPIADQPQELHTTTRLIHSFALGKAFGFEGCEDIIDAGLNFLKKGHRDDRYGGYAWSVQKDGFADDVKLAYGHVFVLLAASSAKSLDHPQADALIDDITNVINEHYWDEEYGLLKDEYTRQWQPFSTYRGFNANMHGTEAFLAAYEATGEVEYLAKAGRILEFFIGNIARNHDWRIPEHFSEDWQVDQEYKGNPMFRPQGTTPGHSLEIGRLLIQHWDLSGRPDNAALSQARHLIYKALEDAWQTQQGLAYTLDYDGKVQIPDRYWWPMTEAIGALATLIKVDGRDDDERWYRKLWQVSSDLFIDHKRGGWYPEVDANNQVTATQFFGKTDIYHALQADFIPLTSDVSRLIEGLKAA